MVYIDKSKIDSILNKEKQETTEQSSELINTYNLYLLKPSIITDVQGQFLTEKSPTGEDKIVLQRVTFQSLPSQVVIAKTNIFNRNKYADIFKKENSDNLEFHNKYIYCDQKLIADRGLMKSEKDAKFVGIFPNDVIGLSDFYFIKDLGDLNALKKLIYFEHPFSDDEITLKRKYGRDRNVAIEELKALRDELNESIYNLNDVRTKTIEYRTVKHQFTDEGFYLLSLDSCAETEAKVLTKRI